MDRQEAQRLQHSRHIAIQEGLRERFDNAAFFAPEHEQNRRLAQGMARENIIRQNYDNAYGRITALPGDVNAPQEQQQPGYFDRKKERKEAKEQMKGEYKKLGSEMRLLRPDEIEALPLFSTAEKRKTWLDGKVSHTKKTRMTVIEEVRNGNYETFENLDLTMRNFFASKAFYNFVKNHDTSGATPPATICRQIRGDNPNDVSRLLDPTLRLGLSLAAKNPAFTSAQRTFFRALDEEMTTQVMVATLVCEGNREAVREDFETRHKLSPKKAAARADAAIEQNKAQQIQLAKRLLLMQLSDFKKVDTTKDKDGNVIDVTKTDWSKTMSVAVSHCSRIVLTLPSVSMMLSGDNLEDAHKEMWNAILYTKDRTGANRNDAQDNKRASSTHSIKRRSVGDDTFGSKEKKLPFNFIGQRGMNVAVGGLGNAGISGRTLSNDGSCGHVYSMHKEGDHEHKGAMLLGIESDQSGVMNQMGHVHDIHATAEKASSFGGQRLDEIGDKYGGRQCDLSAIPAGVIAAYLTRLEEKMRACEGNHDGDFNEMMSLLAGNKMTDEQRHRFEEWIGITNEERLGGIFG